MTTIQSKNQAAIVSSSDSDVPSDASSPDFEPAQVMPQVADLQFSGDPGAMLAALTMATAHSEENADRQERDNALAAQETAQKAEIQDLRDKANLQRIQGVVDGLCDFAQAGMDVAQGVNTLDSSMDRAHADALKDGMAYADKHDTTLPVDVRNTNSEAATSLEVQSDHEAAAANGWKAGTEFIGGAKQITDGVFQGAMTDKDADEKMHGATADTFKRIADDAHDDEKDAKDLMNKALDFYKEYVDAKNQTTMAAIHRA